MSSIIDTATVLDNIVRVRASFSFIEHSFELGRVIREAYGSAAQRLASEIVRNRKFFTMSQDGTGGTVKANCIVMTEEELHAIMMQQFKRGVDHAHGMMGADRLEDHFRVSPKS